MNSKTNWMTIKVLKVPKHWLKWSVALKNQTIHIFYGICGFIFSDTIKRNIDQGQMTGAVLIDFRKAFDSVHHSLLLKRLYALGIVDQEFDWFTDYLKGRTQVFGFQLQGAFSDAESICVGMLQGSILRPLLFVIHVNDLSVVARRCSMLMLLMTLSYFILKRSLLQSRKVSMKILI